MRPSSCLPVAPIRERQVATCGAAARACAARGPAGEGEHELQVRVAGGARRVGVVGLQRGHDGLVPRLRKSGGVGMVRLVASALTRLTRWGSHTPAGGLPRGATAETRLVEDLHAVLLDAAVPELAYLPGERHQRLHLLERGLHQVFGRVDGARGRRGGLAAERASERHGAGRAAAPRNVLQHHSAALLCALRPVATLHKPRGSL